MEEQFSDLTDTPASQLQTAAFVLLQTLQRNHAVRFLFAEEPSMVLQSLNLRLRNNLSWSLLQTETGKWQALVQRAEEVPVKDTLDALRRDHKRIDALFSQVIHLTDQGEITEAELMMAEFLATLQRHLVVEHEMLVAAIRTPPNAMGIDPSAAMVSEHQQILQQSVMICAAFEETDACTRSVSPLLAILAGYLSKHEQREELTMLPIWSRALNHAPQAAQEALFQRVKQQLGYA